MKITALITVAALAMAPSASAWRVYFYQLQNGEGPSITNSGPGGTGSRCHPNVDPLNDKISSMRYYSDNAEGTTRCCIDLYRARTRPPATQFEGMDMWVVVQTRKVEPQMSFEELDSLNDNN
ncbi:hypothetical protein V493_00592 [Pseudogymnoascus sp. VKM F-4281 (FW-2241)]|nr:hypothetical protein V493_00592 [Pseudogymnoascus sp. VKM F-4281 (FW-2241)]